MKSLNIDTNGGGGKARNPYGGPPSSSSSSLKKAVRSYLTFGLALFAIYGVGKVILPSGNKSDPRADAEWALKGDAAGGWGSQHHHPIRTSVSGTSKYSKPAVASSYSNAQYNAAAAAAGEYDDDDVGSPVSPHYHEQKTSVGYGSDNDSDIAALEIKEADYLAVLAPIVRVPSHERKEYEMYQQVDADSGDGFANGESIGSGESIYAEEMLYDRGTPHGMAFDFLLNRDTRPANHDDPHLIQRFVLTLLFYSTGGTDETDPPRQSDGLGGSSNGWDSSAAHFLTSLHECHWVKKSLEDSFWGMLAMESDTDRRVGVTKCNADLEVTEIRLGMCLVSRRCARCIGSWGMYLGDRSTSPNIPPFLSREADLNLIGFIPEEIKWLSSLESLDIQNNHIVSVLESLKVICVMSQVLFFCSRYYCA